MASKEGPTEEPKETEGDQAEARDHHEEDRGLERHCDGRERAAPRWSTPTTWAKAARRPAAGIRRRRTGEPSKTTYRARGRREGPTPRRTPRQRGGPARPRARRVATRRPRPSMRKWTSSSSPVDAARPQTPARGGGGAPQQGRPLRTEEEYSGLAPKSGRTQARPTTKRAANAADHGLASSSRQSTCGRQRAVGAKARIIAVELSERSGDDNGGACI
mmetsp:Transcript_4010/g.16037  ORF Transcript_4010/g.16037 Transcript_4010/m.16037 type:complete len:218 (-) Transcript_4010:332-985(-)